MQNFLECLFEVLIAQGVDEWVQCGVEVAQPDGKHVHMLVATALAEGDDHEEDEVRDPAKNEGCHDETQLFGSLPFSIHVQPRHVLSRMRAEPLPGELDVVQACARPTSRFAFP